MYFPQECLFLYFKSISEKKLIFILFKLVFFVIKSFLYINIKNKF